MDVMARSAQVISSPAENGALAKKAGALTLVEKVEELESQKQKAENALADLGFEVSGSDLELRWNAPHQLAKEYGKHVEEAKPSKKSRSRSMTWRSSESGPLKLRPRRRRLLKV